MDTHPEIPQVRRVRKRALGNDQAFPGGYESPCLAYMPPVPKLRRAMQAMTRLSRGTQEGLDLATSVEDAKHLLLPTHEHAKILIEVTAQIWESYLVRDLRDDDYRRYTISANELLHISFDRHGHRLPIKGGKAPGAKSRGIFVCTPARLGRQRIADAIQDFIGRGVQTIRVDISGQFIDFIQVKTLRVSWPEKGTLRHFAKAFIVEFDSVVGTTYTSYTRGPFFRDEGITPALCALATASNLGLLIVERINCRSATGPAASETWDALGIFTRTTGVPVLCLATPGGAAGLAEQSTSIGDLAPNGLHYLPAPLKNSPAWTAACKVIYQATLAVAGVKEMPAWLPDTAWDLSWGHYGVAVTVCSFTARDMLSRNSQTLDQNSFVKYARECLALEKPHLEAIALATAGGTFKAASIRRHGDWLPLEFVLLTVSSLELLAPTIKASGG